MSADASRAEFVQFGVAWRDPIRNIIVPAGILSYHKDEFCFRYVTGARSPGFRPLPGFPSLDSVYTAARLFPFFQSRVLDPKRPDYAEYVAALGLDAHATVLDVLGRSGGRRLGDKLQMQREPLIEADGTTSCVFLVHGLRFAVRPETESALLTLHPGYNLTLREDRDNPVNKNALLVATADGLAFGWVPEMLVDYVHTARHTAPVSLEVVRVNDPRLPSHLRLLVRLSGTVPRSYRMFATDLWKPIARPQAEVPYDGPSRP